MSAGHGGRRPGSGRPKGAVAKETADIKAMITGALQSLGGVEYFAARALDQPVAFMALVGRVLPLQVTGENGGAIAVDFRWADATPPTIEATAVDTSGTVDTIVDTQFEFLADKADDE